MSDDADARRHRRRRATDVRNAMRDLSQQLSLLNRHVSTRLDLRDADLACLGVLERSGPLGPSALGRRTGQHPATMTGILDRLERGGWIVRERDPADRRAVVVRARRERGGEILALYAGMNTAIEELCAGYDEAQLAAIADFLGRAAAAGTRAVEDLEAG